MTGEGLISASRAAREQERKSDDCWSITRTSSPNIISFFCPFSNICHVWRTDPPIKRIHTTQAEGLISVVGCMSRAAPEENSFRLLLNENLFSLLVLSHFSLTYSSRTSIICHSITLLWKRVSFFCLWYFYITKEWVVAFPCVFNFEHQHKRFSRYIIFSSHSAERDFFTLFSFFSNDVSCRLNEIP